MNDLISIGKILNFHGIKGEVKIGFTRGKEKQIENIKSVTITVDGKDEVLEIDTVRFHKQHALVKFRGINSINDVEKIKGYEIKILREVAAETLEDDEYLISDLIGLKVLNSDEEQIGEVVEVGSNGASELLEIKDANGKIHLVPFVKVLVPLVDMKRQTIVINDIEGLIE